MVNEIRELFDFINTAGRSILYTSRAASTPEEEPKHDVRITEVVDGLIVTRPARKYTDLNQAPKQQEDEKHGSGPVVIDLQEHAKSKAGSYRVTRQGVNEVKELFDFMRHYGRI